MTTTEIEAVITQAERDLAANDWRQAYTRLEEIGPDRLPPRGLTLLARAAWWLGRIDRSVDAWQRAYNGWTELGEPERAAEASLEIAAAYFHRLQPNVGQAWFRRAETLLSGRPESSTQAWMYRMQAQQTSEAEAALDLIKQAWAIAERLDDRDLMAITRHDLGRLTVAMGNAGEGLAMMEEVMADVLAGNIGPRVTGRIYCNMLDACGQLADYGRAAEWDQAARAWCSQVTDHSPFPGICRVRRAQIKRVSGALGEAENEARKAIEDLAEFLDFGAQAWIEVGEVKLRQGDREAAVEAFSRARSAGADPQPGLAMVEFELGRLGEARAMLELALASQSGPLGRLRLLPALAEVLAAEGDLEALRPVTEELTELSTRYPSTALAASAATATGLQALVEGNTNSAVGALQNATLKWSETRAPYEAGKAHLFLAKALEAAGQFGLADLERKAAAALFAEIGAVQPGHLRTPGSEVGLLHTDIVRSTDLISAIGDEAWTHLLRWHDLTLRKLFTSHGGVERGHAGDGFLVSFANPGAALECAVSIQQRLDQQRREQGFAPEVRIGLHYGKADLVGDTLTGEAVHTCARIGSLAASNEILASGSLVRAVPNPRYRDIRALPLRGIPQPVEVATVSWR